MLVHNGFAESIVNGKLQGTVHPSPTIAIVKHHPPTHNERRMVSGHETIFVGFWLPN
jgi:hypothetical protein